MLSTHRVPRRGTPRVSPRCHQREAGVAEGRRTGLIYQPEMIGRAPLTVTSHGKAWLSTLPPEEAMRIVREEGFPPPGRYGPRAIQSIDAFAAAVDETRARGWGMSYEEGER